VLHILKWFIYDFAGLRFIIEKKIPPKEPSTGKRNPSTFIFWILGLYTALFGIAYQRYEHKIDSIKNQIDSLNYQIISPYYKFALSKIPPIQSHLKTPCKPDIKNPLTVFNSLFSPDYS
jgi:hypothetical protein